MGVAEFWDAGIDVENACVRIASMTETRRKTIRITEPRSKGEPKLRGGDTYQPSGPVGMTSTAQGAVAQWQQALLSWPRRWRRANNPLSICTVCKDTQIRRTRLVIWTPPPQTKREYFP